MYKTKNKVVKESNLVSEGMNVGQAATLRV